MRILLRVSRPLATNALCLTVWRNYKLFGQIDFDVLDVAAEQLGLAEATQNFVEDPAYAVTVYGHLRAGNPSPCSPPCVASRARSGPPGREGR